MKKTANNLNRMHNISMSVDGDVEKFFLLQEYETVVGNRRLSLVSYL